MDSAVIQVVHERDETQATIAIGIVGRRDLLIPRNDDVVSPSRRISMRFDLLAQIRDGIQGVDKLFVAILVLERQPGGVGRETPEAKVRHGGAVGVIPRQRIQVVAVRTAAAVAAVGRGLVMPQHLREEGKGGQFAGMQLGRAVVERLGGVFGGQHDLRRDVQHARGGRRVVRRDGVHVLSLAVVGG